MNSKLMNVTGHAPRGLLVAAALFLHHDVTAVPFPYTPELGTVTLTPEINPGDAVSVRAKRASLSGFSTTATPTLGSTSVGTIGGGTTFAGGGGGGGGGGFIPFLGGYGGGVPAAPIGTPPPPAIGAGSPGVGGNVPVGLPPPAASAGPIQVGGGIPPGSVSSPPAGLPTPPSGGAFTVPGLPISPGVPPAASAGGTPPSNPPIPVAIPPGTVGPVVTPVPAPPGAAFPITSPVTMPIGAIGPGVPTSTALVPDSGSTLILFSIGLVIMLAIRGRFSPLA